MATDTKSLEQEEQFDATLSEEERMICLQNIRQEEYQKVAQQFDNCEKRLEAKKLRMEQKYGKDFVETEIPAYIFNPYENPHSKLLREIVEYTQKVEQEYDWTRKGEVDFYFDDEGNTAIPFFREDHVFLDLIYQLPSTSADQTYGRYCFTSPSSSATNLDVTLCKKEAEETGVKDTSNANDLSTCFKEKDIHRTDNITTPTEVALTERKQPEVVTPERKAATKNMFRRFGKWIRKQFRCCQKSEE